MNETVGPVFVLWGKRCDESIATLFVGSLRAADVPVRLVGLTLRAVTGLHGIALTPDLTLERAMPLAERASAVIVPCPSGAMHRMGEDPRLAIFCQKAQRHHARFVLAETTQNSLPAFLPEGVDLTFYPAGLGDSEFIHALVASLGGRTPGPI